MIFQATEQIRKFLPANISLDVENIAPYLNQAEQLYLGNVLGSEQLAALLDYSNDINTDEKLDALLQVCMPAVLHLAIYDNFDLLNVTFSDAGFRRSESETSKSLFGYQERNIKANLSKLGFNELDAILVFLEKNEADYPLWADSDACSLAYSNLLRNAAEFTAIYTPLRGSSLIFRLLKSALTETEDFDIKPILGEDLFDKLLEMVKDREIDLPDNSDYKKLLGVCQKPLAYLAIARGAETIGAGFTDIGLLFKTVEPGLDDIKASNDASNVASIVSKAYANGRGYITQLYSYLELNSDKFSEFVQPVDVSEYPDQTGKKVHTMY